MALNLATFKKRTLTAIVFVVIMLVGLLWNFWSFLILCSIIHVGCWLEYQKLIAKIDENYKNISVFHKFIIIVIGFFLIFFFTNNAFEIFNISPNELRSWGYLHDIGSWGLVLSSLLLPFGLYYSSYQRNIVYSLGGIIYISLPIGLLVNLYCFGNDLDRTSGSFLDLDCIILPSILIGTLWINDTMAYIVGSLIGKTPFSKISPGKTWEGTIGGAILAIVVVANILKLLNPHTPIIMAILSPLIITIAGTAGDLFESRLKRMANVKDSGNTMPGHGGFLDRFDSLLFATPLLWLYVFILVSFFLFKIRIVYMNYHEIVADLFTYFFKINFA